MRLKVNNLLVRGGVSVHIVHGEGIVNGSHSGHELQ